METPLPDGVTGVHVVSSGDMKILMFRLFNESLEGQYVCRNEGGEEFVINVSTGVFLKHSITVFVCRCLIM